MSEEDLYNNGPQQWAEFAKRLKQYMEMKGDSEYDTLFAHFEKEEWTDNLGSLHEDYKEGPGEALCINGMALPKEDGVRLNQRIYDVLTGKDLNPVEEEKTNPPQPKPIKQTKNQQRITKKRNPNEIISSTVEVQIDQTHWQHFKYTWNVYITGNKKHTLLDLKDALRNQLREASLFGNNSKYKLFISEDNTPTEIPDEKNEDQRELKNGEQYALMTNDGNTFYAQAIGQEASQQMFQRLQKTQEKMFEELNRQISQMKIDSKIKDVEHNYDMFKIEKNKFDTKTEKLNQMNKQYQKIYAALKKEHDRLQSTHFEQIQDPKIKQLVLLGKTGDGKSTFGNRLCGDTSKYGNGGGKSDEYKGVKGPFKATNDTKSVTQEINKSITERNGIKYAVVDTPGIFDSDGADYENAQNLVKYLKGCGGVNTFIVVGKPPRLDSAFQEMLKNLNFMLGEGFWDHVIFIITHLNMNDEYKDDEEMIKPKQWLRSFQMKVKSTLKMPRFPEAIGVDNWNEESYMEAINELLAKMSKEKFMCDQLKSPFDAQKKKCQEVFDEMKSKLDDRKETQDEMFDLAGKIAKLVKNIQQNTPEYQTKFKDLDVNNLITQVEPIEFHDLSIIDRKSEEKNNNDEKRNDENFIDESNLDNTDGEEVSVEPESLGQHGKASDEAKKIKQKEEVVSSPDD